MVNCMASKKSLIFGVALNDAEYNVKPRSKILRCRFYDCWLDMIVRCYSEKFKERHPSYYGCSVCDEWLVFSKFKHWMEKQDWQGKQLDKDIIKLNNKIYSPENCAFVTCETNNFVLGFKRGGSSEKAGVSWNKNANKYESYCNNPFTKKKEHLGLHLTESEAHESWRTRKLFFAHSLAKKQADCRVAKALILRYSPATSL